MFKRFMGIREPPPRRREVSRTRLVIVGLAVVVGGSRQILPTATISFFISYGFERGGTGDARAGFVKSSAGIEYCSWRISASESILSSRTVINIGFI